MLSKTLIAGVVEKVYKKDNGIYSIKLDNVWYGCYKSNPGDIEGKHVTFNAEEKNGYMNCDVKSIKVSKDDAPVAVAAKAVASAKDNDKQNAIQYQNARSHALEFLGLMNSAQLLDFGKAKSKGSMIDVLETQLDMYTQRFFEDTSNLGHTTDVAPTPADLMPDDDTIPF